MPNLSIMKSPNLQRTSQASSSLSSKRMPGISGSEEEVWVVIDISNCGDQGSSHRKHGIPGGAGACWWRARKVIMDGRGEKVMGGEYIFKCGNSGVWIVSNLLTLPLGSRF